MRSAANVPANQWDEFVKTAAYLSERLPTRAQKDKTPYEAWYNRKPDLSHLREIGCLAFVLVQNRHNPKIYDRSIECVLIGYSENSKAYRCYHRTSKKVLTSFNVVFIESKDEISRPLHPGLVLEGEKADPEPAKPPFKPSDNNDTPASPPIQVPNSILTPSDAPVMIKSPDEEEEEEIGVPLPEIKPARRSTRERKGPGPTRTEIAVEEAKASGIRVREERKARREAKLAAREANQSDSETRDNATHGEDNLATLAAVLENGFDLTYPDDTPTLKVALESDEAPQWQRALESEFTSLKKLDLYELIPRNNVPRGRKIMHGKGVCKRKRDAQGIVQRHKIRWVLLGVYGQDYTKTTSPTARMESLRLLAHIGASLDWDMQQWDIKQLTFMVYSMSPVICPNQKDLRSRAKRIGCGN